MLKRLKNYIVLPAEITDFERAYLKRINKIALYFFLGHLPAFVLVSAIAGTGPARAALVTALVLIGPVVAYLTLKNPRHMSIASGFTAMCLGGLLVHFGRGAMQIEMHFYFFVLIALLAVFANPTAVITAAVTVAVHHLLVFLLFPRSVFNYDASIWAVVVHALFVVLESIAACFVARSFFDNVIGLERIVADRTKELDGRNRAMGLVLDNVDQGFLTVSLDGRLDRERSAVTETWLGSDVEGKAIWDALAPLNTDVAKWLEVGWAALAQDILPADVAIDQLPKRIARGQQVWSLSYKPIMDEAATTVSKVLLVMTDITADVNRELAEMEQRDFQRVISHITRDRAGFLEFLEESEKLVQQLKAGDLEVTTLKRLVHTLKGNCALFGLSRLVAVYHDAETSIEEQEETLSPEQRERIEQEWRHFADKMAEIIGGGKASMIEVEERDIDGLMLEVRGSMAREVLAERLLAWKLEPTARRLQRVADQIRATAARLGLTSVEVGIEANELRLAPEPLREFWGSFPHAVRNALDHGIESPEERRASGKPPTGQIALATRKQGDSFVVEISDDGRGIDWDAVRQRGQAKGIPHESRDDLVAALFHDGLSTKNEITETSGRGVGMGSLRSACSKNGGVVEVTSVAGRGTTLRFIWSWQQLVGQAGLVQQQRSAG